MIFTTFIGFLAVLFAFLGKFKNIQIGLKLSFIIIFLFLALRYDFGNDYMGYLEMFNEINVIKYYNYFDLSTRIEPGWVFLCRLFKIPGFFVMIAFLALANCIILYKFIKQYVTKEYYWLAVFIYFFNSGFLLTYASAMRQSVAISFFLISLNFLIQRKKTLFILTILIASLFHTSALIGLTLLPLLFIKKRIEKTEIIVFLSVFLFLFTFGNRLLPDFNQIIATYLIKYKGYEQSGEIGSGLGLIYFTFILFLILYYQRFQNNEVALIYRISVLSYIFIPLSLMILMAGRMGWYFATTLIITYPILAETIKNKYLKLTFITSLVFMTLYTYIQFFNSETYSKYFSTYKTIFSLI